MRKPQLPRLPPLGSTKLGKAILTVFIAVTLVSIAAANLPDSSLRRALDRFAQPYRNAVGLSQRWALFAPDPYRQSKFVEARLVYLDGGLTTWRFPRGGALRDAYWTFRWRKLAEAQVTRKRRTAAALWDQTASWLARRESDRGRPVKAVVLILRQRDLKPPGVTPETGPWRSKAFHLWWAPGQRPKRG